MTTDPGFRNLASDSGQLLRVHGHRQRSGRYYGLALAFSNGVLTVRCDDDTDEVRVTVDAEVPDGMAPVDHDENLRGLDGMVIEWAWTLTNHRGYSDGLQIRLLDLDSREQQARQFEVAASAINVYRATV